MNSKLRFSYSHISLNCLNKKEILRSLNQESSFRKPHQKSRANFTNCLSFFFFFLLVLLFWVLISLRNHCWKMPSSPKLSYAPQYSFFRRSTARIICFQIFLLGFIIGIIAISRHGLRDKCKYDKPLSVSVAWDKSSSGGDSSSSNGGISDEGQKRHKVMGFVGIQTGFGSIGRRKALRQTWFPSEHQGLQRYSLFFHLIMPLIVFFSFYAFWFLCGLPDIMFLFALIGFVFLYRFKI